MTHDMAELRARMLRAVHHVCPAQLRNETEDLAQMGMIRLLRQLDREPDRPISYGYLKKVAWSVAIDELRRRRLERQCWLEDDHHEPVSQGPDVDEQWDRHQALKQVSAGLERLNENRRRAVSAWLLGYTAPETAARNGWTTKKAEVLTYRGVAQLRAALGAA